MGAGEGEVILSITLGKFFVPIRLPSLSHSITPKKNRKRLAQFNKYSLKFEAHVKCYLLNPGHSIPRYIWPLRHWIKCFYKLALFFYYNIIWIIFYAEEKMAAIWMRGNPKYKNMTFSSLDCYIIAATIDNGCSPLFFWLTGMD